MYCRLLIRLYLYELYISFGCELVRGPTDLESCSRLFCFVGVGPMALDALVAELNVQKSLLISSCYVLLVLVCLYFASHFPLLISMLMSWKCLNGVYFLEGYNVCCSANPSVDAPIMPATTKQTTASETA